MECFSEDQNTPAGSFNGRCYIRKRWTRILFRPLLGECKWEFFVILILGGPASHKSLRALKIFHANKIWWSPHEKRTAAAGRGCLSPLLRGDGQIRDKASGWTYQRLCMRNTDSSKKCPTQGFSTTQHNGSSTTGWRFVTRSWHHQR